MREVEVKIIEIDRDKVEERLRSLGASKTFEGDIETVFFDLPSKSIASAEDLFRLRRKGDKSELTFKRFVADKTAKVREEYEVGVSDFDTTRLILESVGFVGYQRMKKHRISYVLKDGVSVDLDKFADDLSHIPDLMEIEAKNSSDVYAHVKLLGFEPEDAKAWTTFDLINYYSTRSGKS